MFDSKQGKAIKVDEQPLVAVPAGYHVGHEIIVKPTPRERLQ